MPRRAKIDYKELLDGPQHIVCGKVVDKLEAENARYRKLPGMLDDACQWITALIDPSESTSEEDKQRAIVFVADARKLLALTQEAGQQ